MLSIASPPTLDHPKIKWAFLQLEELRGAVLRFKTDSGQLPASLMQVQAAGYLIRGIPSDPWGNEYVYRKNANKFTLYSVGIDGVDERGAGDDVTDRHKHYSCSDYRVGCPFEGVELLQVVLVLLFAISALYLIALLAQVSIRWARSPSTRRG